MIITEAELRKIAEATPGGKFTAEQEASIDAKFKASEAAFAPSVQSLKDSRKPTAESLGFVINTR